MAHLLITLTLNPAVDLSSSTEAVVPTHKIRTEGEHIDPGGGGINVARVIHALGGDTLAVILAGGATGRLVEELVQEEGVPMCVLPLAGRTRVSLSVYDRSARQEYRFEPEGPEVSPDELAATLTTLEGIDGAWLVASGSVPRGVPHDIYAQLAQISHRRGMRFVLDTSGEPLHLALHRGLDLVKPSLRELEMLVGRQLREEKAQEAAAMNLVRASAARMVAVTCGADGAFLATEDGIIRMPALDGPVRTAVGAGDAFLASMVLALSRGASPGDAMAWGIAGGTAAVGALGTARMSLATVETQYRRLVPDYQGGGVGTYRGGSNGDGGLARRLA